MNLPYRKPTSADPGFDSPAESQSPVSGADLCVKETFRTVELLDVPVRVCINHGHLDPAMRVEDHELNFERLLFSVQANYCGPHSLPPGPEAFHDVINYAPVYSCIKAMDRIIIDGPLESLLDQIAPTIEQQVLAMHDRGVRLVSLDLWVVRPELIDTRIKARFHRDY